LQAALDVFSFPILGNLLDRLPETGIEVRVQIIAKSTLKEFWEREPRAETPLRTWYRTVSAARWTGPADVKATFGITVDFVGDNRVIFDLGGNKYRLIVHFAYAYNRALIKFVGTHREYDRIDPETV
jgi:mRNA interferase HigB